MSNEISTARPVIKVTRRIYAEHKIYGTCVTLGAFVYAAPVGACTLTRKDAVKADFTVQGEGYDATVTDCNGINWVCMGENGGCGPRCPTGLKATHGKSWHSMSFAERKTLLASLTPPAAPAEAPAAE